ncbi:MAG: hypothetical protein OMM_07485 [Candidatus Magnetoglobus multicellularis str. Araruama]|uniref:Uncharacterized protein n=1 Tax=Candidatus Magnetoglobus multicellularis str. Araruama TaxID=890399 RepID=A0A1V1PCJ9_9BACT|nr:MAG: hypothetical protein OMM_07485 [Candidatus Magnetoglobus multicellularis str. Araruama]
MTHKPDDLIAMNNLAVLLLSKARYGESVRLLKTVYNTDIADKKFKSEVSKTLAVASFHLAEALADHSDKKSKPFKLMRTIWNMLTIYLKKSLNKLKIKFQRFNKDAKKY